MGFNELVATAIEGTADLGKWLLDELHSIDSRFRSKWSLNALLCLIYSRGRIVC